MANRYHGDGKSSLFYFIFIQFKEYDIFDKELKISEINPIFYWLKLFLGIFFALLSFVIWLHMFLLLLFLF